MASVAPRWDARAQSVVLFLQEINIGDLDLWPHLDALSTHTSIEAVEVPIEGVVFGLGENFTAILNLYLTLQYGKDDEEGFTTSDSFRAKVEGHLEDGTPVIDRSSVDTSSFYE